MAIHRLIKANQVNRDSTIKCFKDSQKNKLKWDRNPYLVFYLDFEIHSAIEVPEIQKLTGGELTTLDLEVSFPYY